MNIYKKLGLVSDQTGIINRYNREKENWDFHCQRTKDFILKSTETKANKSVAIFGSGWLLDVPIAELNSRFLQVYCFDLHHPAEIVHKYRKQTNIHFVESDITGGWILWTYNLLKNKQLQQNLVLPDFKFSHEIDFDFYVSVNILNQLDILICDILNEHKIGNKLIIQQIKQQIQQSHIQMLRTGKSGLISDITEQQVNNENEISEKINLIYTDLPKPNFNENWIWKFDTHKTYHNHCNTHFEVVAIDF